MGKAIVIIGVGLFTVWMVFFGLAVVILIDSGSIQNSPFGHPIPWFRWLNYSALFCVIGATIHYIEKDEK